MIQSQSNSVTQIGIPPWEVGQLRELAFEFEATYRSRPILENDGGMKSPHMFAVFAMLRALEPQVVIESGVWKGGGTWLIEQAVPDAHVISIDPNLRNLVYRSPRADYSTLDFNLHDWSQLPEGSVVLFDDHQDAFVRLQQSLWHGVNHVIFEDNYPPSQGDCYSLKKLFSGSGFQPTPPSSLRGRIRQRACGQQAGGVVPPSKKQQRSVLDNLVTYSEFPPVVQPDETRWGDDWTDTAYPTPEALFDIDDSRVPDFFVAEAQHYTWIAYAQLRGTVLAEQA